MLLGLGLTIWTAIIYFSPMKVDLLDTFIITVFKTHQFNLAPMIGIAIMAIGEIVLWNSPKNKNILDTKINSISSYTMKQSYRRFWLQHS